MMEVPNRRMRPQSPLIGSDVAPPPPISPMQFAAMAPMIAPPDVMGPAVSNLAMALQSRMSGDEEENAPPPQQTDAPARRFKRPFADLMQRYQMPGEGYA